jgi:ABC-2 type transport system permease protein
MKLLTDIKLLVKRPFLQEFHNPTWLFVSGSTPIMYLVLFMPLLKRLSSGPGFSTGNVIQLFLPGIIALLAFGTGNFAGFSTIFQLRNGFIERLRVTPASRFALLIGPILSSMAWSLIFSAVIVCLSVPFGFHIHLMGLLVYTLLLITMIILFSSISTSLAILAREISTFAAIVNGINLPLILLGGVMLPLTLAPNWMRFIAHVNPLYYVVEAGRALANGQIGVNAVGVAFAVMLPLTIIVLWWSMRIYSKAVS